MTQIQCPVIEVHLTKHPEADALSIVMVDSYPVIVRSEDWTEGEFGAYCPVDSVMPDLPEYAFLDGHLRIKARRFRGRYSEGLLVKAPEGAQVGDDVASILGVTKYVPPEPKLQQGDATAAPRVRFRRNEIDPPVEVDVPTYTDVEYCRRYANKVFQPDEMIVVSEKLHGCNGRWLLCDGELHVGSHHQWKKGPDDPWWRVATPNFREWLTHLAPGYIVFGEVYGDVQDLKYGHKQGQVSVRVFDIYDAFRRTYLDWYDLEEIMERADRMFDVKAVPTLAVMPYNLDALIELAEQDSLVGGKGHIREGVVIRPLVERYDHKVGRCILKLISQRYLLRRGA